MWEFPFDVPESLNSLDRDGLVALRGQFVSYAAELLAGDEPADEGVAATTANIEAIDARLAQLDSRDKLASFTAQPEEEDGGDGDDAGDGGGDDAGGDSEAAGAEGKEAVTASTGGSTRPPAAAVAKRVPPPDVTPVDNSAYVSMVAAADVADFSAGTKLETFTSAAQAVESRLRSYGKTSSPSRRTPNERWNGRSNSNISRRLSDAQREVLASSYGLRNPVRHGAVRFNRDYPEELRVTDGDNAYDKVLKVADEKRLPGGSLTASIEAQVKAGRALTAAAGWCAASETIYSLCELESMDGILDLPELQADRGGFNIPEDGGPDFSVIWNGIGNSGDVILTEYEVQQDTPKVCTDIPCPDFVDVRLDVAYACLTGSLLQRRGYPEIVERFSRGAMVALAHKKNQAVIAALVAAAGTATTIPEDATGDDAAAALLSAVDLAITDMKYRHRMPFGATLEVVLPLWAIVPVRAALARRNGVALLDVSDADIARWFAVRDAAPRFVYDWQDALTGLGGGPGGASSLTALPATANFLVYPSGTFTLAVADVVSLDTIYDSSNLATNEYIALFTEDGFAVLQTCPDARQYTVTLDPSGCVGCGGAVS